MEVTCLRERVCSSFGERTTGEKLRDFGSEESLEFAMICSERRALLVVVMLISWYFAMFFFVYVSRSVNVEVDFCFMTVSNEYVNTPLSFPPSTVCFAVCESFAAPMQMTLRGGFPDGKLTGSSKLYIVPL